MFGRDQSLHLVAISKAVLIPGLRTGDTEGKKMKAIVVPHAFAHTLPFVAVRHPLLVGGGGMWHHVLCASRNPAIA